MTEEATAPTTEQKSYSLLASEQYGSNFHGEVTEPVEEVIEEVEEPTEEPTEELEEATPEPVEENSQEYEEYQLGQIATLLGVDEGQLDVNEEGRIVLNGKVNGEPVKANAADLLANYQMFQAAEQRLAEAKESARTQSQELATKRESLQAEYAKAAKLIESAESLLEEDFKAIDWKKLRADDPAEWSAKQKDFDNRRATIDKIKSEASLAQGEFSQGNEKEMEAAYAQYVEEQRPLLLQKVPSWEDPSTHQAESKQVQSYLAANFSDEELRSPTFKWLAANAAFISMAREAALYQNVEAGKSVVAQKVAKIPKVVKPGTTKTTEQVNQQTIEKLRANLKRTGSVEDAHALQKALRKMK